MVVRGDVGSQQGHYRIESASQMGPSCVGVCMFLLLKDSGFLPQSIGMHVRLSSDIKLGMNMDHSVNECKMLS